MSANVQTMFSGRNIIPWHREGLVVDGMLNASDAIKAAGLNWTVSKKPLEYTFNGERKVSRHALSIVRDDNGMELGTTGNVWTAFQNHEAFSWMDAVIGEKLAIYDSAGALGVGERVWMLAKIDGVMRINNTEDTIDKYLLVSNSFNGKTSIEVALTTVRVVCANTLALGLGEAKKANQLFKIRHTKQVGSKIEDVREKLGIVNKWFYEFNEAANKLAKVELTKARVDALIKGIGLDDDSDSKREEKKVDEIKRLMREGTGNQMKGVKDTLWAGLQGITEYVDYFSGTRKTDSFKSADQARFAAAQFGVGNDLKQKALEVALQLAA